MQFDRAGRKKAYRARGTRGGRRRKGSSRALQGKSPYSINNTKSNSDGDEMNPVSLSRSLSGCSEHNLNKNLHRELRSEEAPITLSNSRSTQDRPKQQCQPHPHVSVQYSQAQLNNHSVPPPLQFINSCSSFSSQSSSSGHNIDCSSSENYHEVPYSYTQNPLVTHNLAASRQEYVHGSRQKYVHGTMEGRQMRRNITSVEDSWTSLFLISPRSHLMGQKR